MGIPDAQENGEILESNPQPKQATAIRWQPTPGEEKKGISLHAKRLSCRVVGSKQWRNFKFRSSPCKKII